MIEPLFVTNISLLAALYLWHQCVIRSSDNLHNRSDWFSDLSQWNDITIDFSVRAAELTMQMMFGIHYKGVILTD